MQRVIHIVLADWVSTDPPFLPPFLPPSLPPYLLALLSFPRTSSFPFEYIPSSFNSLWLQHADKVPLRPSLLSLPSSPPQLSPPSLAQVAIAKMLGRVGCPHCHRNFNTTHIVTDTYDMPAILPPSLPSSSSPSSSPSSSSSSSLCPGGITLQECPAVAAAAAGREGGREGGWTRRSDDTEETVKRRLDTYREDAQPLLDFYKKEGKLRVFEVFKGVKDAQALEKMMLAEE